MPRILKNPGEERLLSTEKQELTDEEKLQVAENLEAVFVTPDGVNEKVAVETAARIAGDKASRRMYNVTSYGAVGDGITDDTVAIQATISAVAGAGGGTVYFPIGQYLINGPFLPIPGVSPTRYAQLIIPATADNQVNMPTIQFKGETAPYRYQDVWLTGPTALPTSGTMLIGGQIGDNIDRSMLASAALPSIWKDQNNSFIRLEDLHFRLKSKVSGVDVDPQMTAVDLRVASYCGVTRCRFDTQTPGRDMPATIATNPTYSCGLYLPLITNLVGCTVDYCDFQGFFVGVQASEHATFYDTKVSCCRGGIQINDPSHAVWFSNVKIHWCKFPIVFFNPGGIETHCAGNIQFERYVPGINAAGYTSESRFYDGEAEIYSVNGDKVSGLLKMSGTQIGGIPVSPIILGDAPRLHILDLNTMDYLGSFKPKSLTLGTQLNERSGFGTLNAGQKVFGNTSVTDKTMVILSRKTAMGTVGVALDWDIDPGVGLTVYSRKSDSTIETADISFIEYILIEKTVAS